METEEERGWCPACERAERSDEDFACVECGEPLVPWDELDGSLREIIQFQDWLEDVLRKGLNGPSPGGAAAELGCHRSMIDKLVDRSVLEKSEYHFGDQHVILISDRSIERAKESKRRTGKWTKLKLEPEGESDE